MSLGNQSFLVQIRKACPNDSKVLQKFMESSFRSKKDTEPGLDLKNFKCHLHTFFYSGPGCDHLQTWCGLICYTFSSLFLCRHVPAGGGSSWAGTPGGAAAPTCKPSHCEAPELRPSLNWKGFLFIALKAAMMISSRAAGRGRGIAKAVTAVGRGPGGLWRRAQPETPGPGPPRYYRAGGGISLPRARASPRLRLGPGPGHWHVTGPGPGRDPGPGPVTSHRAWVRPDWERLREAECCSGSEITELESRRPRWPGPAGGLGGTGRKFASPAQHRRRGGGAGRPGRIMQRTMMSGSYRDSDHTISLSRKVLSS